MREDATETVSETLRMSEAGPLLTAWVSWFLAERGVRFLVIKGAALTHHGLRAARISSDVDVLVDPTDVDAAVVALVDAGWRLRPTTFAQQRYSEHSVSLIHNSWPIDIDVHHAFPGFLQDPTRTFDVLWERRETICIADVPAPVPDRHSSALILALHSYRGRSAETRHSRELDELLVALRSTDGDAYDLLALAVASGSDASLRDFFADLGVAFSPSRGDDDPALIAWNERVHSPSRSAHMWLHLIRSARGWRKVEALRHAVWPNAEDLDILHSGGGRAASQREYFRLRMRRLSRGVPVLRGMAALWWRRGPGSSSWS
ncbi:nucleotidyltransferase family protein [Microbacterium sp.]|uniref:nucleotidyltransferase family protein n=1 Tax=Microbacterium sp. TaxID=51671 RepID=UPI0025EA3192|nr:nucleotidyltransferase family protein [Microbacterium sp.]MBT9606347.1 nucleotidyltransferase family protein [Microbacterium sp.]